MRIAKACLALILVLAAAASVRAEDAADYVYPSVPKGIVLEGTAAGIEPINSITYNAQRNGFVINGNAYYLNPIDKAEFKELLDALSLHNHVGVSIRPDRSFFTYGRIASNSRVGREMANADRLLGGVLFAVREYTGNRRLPGGYSPKGVSSRRVLSTSTFAFKDYFFSKDGQGVYRRTGYAFDITMRPVKMNQRAPDGGYMPDYDAQARGDIEPADRENFNHMMQYKNDYVAMPEVEKVVRIGEAASFIRWVRGGTSHKGQLSGGNVQLLQALSAQMR